MWRIVIACICCGQCLSAYGETAYKSQDGALYVVRDSTAGPRFEKLTIVDLTDGINPNPPKPDDNDDRFGLAKVSKDAFDSVPAYPQRLDHAAKLGAYYTGLAGPVRAGTIPKDKLDATVSQVFAMAVDADADKWNQWRLDTNQAFELAPIMTADDAAEALADIGAGLKSESAHSAVDWEKLIEFFIEHILPLIIKLIGS